MKIVKVEMGKPDFIKHMKKEMQDFRSHVSRVNHQYAEVRKLKESLPSDEVAIQMDFSENYNCQTMEEIQSAYWNAEMVTVHPAVVYHKN
ncbi:Hypp4122 [Branchiostoma lanceolatum]|uniref:Hypp4122 protein n=1 Tax=Branchiostoma lanceolatum TaxID=7740 RepID=A0A8K0EX07_BRALA|nr:Hypp4122 [Branchiostoma lanceolatum]